MAATLWGFASLLRRTAPRATGRGTVRVLSGVRPPAASPVLPRKDRFLRAFSRGTYRATKGRSPGAPQDRRMAAKGALGRGDRQAYERGGGGSVRAHRGTRSGRGGIPEAAQARPPQDRTDRQGGAGSRTG